MPKTQLIWFLCGLWFSKKGGLKSKGAIRGFREILLSMLWERLLVRRFLGLRVKRWLVFKHRIDFHRFNLIILMYQNCTHMLQKRTMLETRIHWIRVGLKTVTIMLFLNCLVWQEGTIWFYFMTLWKQPVILGNGIRQILCGHQV